MSPEVGQALRYGQPVVALESTVIAHGLPYPMNLESARRMEATVRRNGAVPATVAVLEGQIRVGLADAELEQLATAEDIRKVSCRDLPVIVAQGKHGATTVAATATIASWAGIQVFATGGIGGVHIDPPFDVSNDLPTLASVPVAVVCAGAKSILNLRATLEWLETAGVPVIGYRTDEFPAFYSRHSGLAVDVRVDTPTDAAIIIHSSLRLGLAAGVLIAVPVPQTDELAADKLESMVEAALSQAQAQGIKGSEITPFLLSWIARQSDGASLRANIALLDNNAAVGAQVAVALRELQRSPSP